MRYLEKEKSVINNNIVIDCLKSDVKIYIISLVVTKPL